MVYPRVCGGNSYQLTTPRSMKGLSPRVRGKPVSGFQPGTASGSIPACAGETQQRFGFRASGRVYPRVCGGNRRRWRCLAGIRGLSPRVRGKRAVVGCGVDNVRSIPACAGETATARRCRLCRAVYPRVCGGNRPGRHSRQRPRHLSPRVRGKPFPAGLPLWQWRSIPACAGETGEEIRAAGDSEVYPRVCGGNPAILSGAVLAQGLSPRVRGKRSALLRRRNRNGSIPACAGETYPTQAHSTPRKVYPRVCGGNDWCRRMGRC